MNTLANEMDVQLDVLGPLVMNGVHRHVHGRDVVVVGDGRLGHATMELAEKLSEPYTFSRGVRDNTILSLGVLTGDRGLPFRRPGHQGVAEEHTEARCRAPSVRAARPVGVRVRRDSEVR